MAKFEKVPAYALSGTTPQDIAAARVALDRRRLVDPSFDLQMPFRRSAFAARLGCAMPLTAEQIAEFGAAVPEGYASRFEVTQALAAQAATIQADAKAKWNADEADRKPIATTEPRKITDQREAQETLSAEAYGHWVQENQHIIARMSF